jgi:hypothetical protein
MEKFLETTKQAGHARELKRLSDNHEVFKDAMGGLLLAPVNLSKPGLRILDSATADGTYLTESFRSLGWPKGYQARLMSCLIARPAFSTSCF